MKTQPTVARQSSTVVMTDHDDWIVNVLLSNGRIYAFITELWDEHSAAVWNGEPGTADDWKAVTDEAGRRALDLNSRDVDTLDCEVLPRNVAELREIINDRVVRMSDADFDRFMHH